MGILVPPNGYTYTAYGGFGYIPSQGFTVGAGTRTAIGVQIGWFARATQARDNVAHELGHNFGRAHAPCGAAASPDPLFPNAGGVIGAIGHDVFSWTNGDATSAVAFPAQTGDLMGYCTPIWISEYMYKNVLQFRGSIVASVQRAPDPVRSLIVRGHIEDNARMVLEPAFTIIARPTTPERTGNYRLVGRAADGHELFSYNFEPAALDHAANVRQFLFAIPATKAIDDSLATIEVTGAGAGAQLRAQPSASLRLAGIAASTSSGDLTNVACADRSARGILVSDAATGTMLGTATASSVQLAVPPGMHVSVSCSDGVHTSRSEIALP
jgi:hypothetical protein